MGSILDTWRQWTGLLLHWFGYGSCTGQFADQATCKRDCDEITRIARTGTGEELKAAFERLGHTADCVDNVHNRTKVRSLLQVACCDENLGTVEALLNLGASPHGRKPIQEHSTRIGCEGGRYMVYRCGLSCMHLAVRTGNTKMIGLLIGHGFGQLVNARTMDEEKMTPLMVATTRHAKLCRSDCSQSLGKWVGLAWTLTL